MNIKNLMASVVILAAVSVFAGDTYWADANNGNDAYSGTAREWAGGATDAKGQEIGPRKSLKAAMALAKSGDTVYALPGEYRDEVDTLLVGVTEYTARVCVKDGVKLISTAGRDKTFIYGQPSPTPEAGNPQGVGPDAVRCVFLRSSGAVFGFTLTDGHTICVDSGTGHGGGAYADGTGAVVDCVISNCYAVRGGAASGSKLSVVNSILDGCGTYWKTGKGLYQGTAWGCLFRNMNGTDTYNAKAYNCTIDGYAQGTSVPPNMKCWNSVVYWDGGYVLATNCCRFGSAVTGSDWSGSPAEWVGLPSRDTQLAIDADGMPIKGKHVGIDGADWDLYTNNFPAIAADYLYKDANGKRRIVNGAMDVGAVECDYLQAFTDDLANRRLYFAVTNFSDGVYEKAEGAQVALPAGEELLAAWNIPAQDTRTETYSFEAVLSGDAVLKVYVDGDLKLTVTKSGAASYTHVGSHGVRFVCEGTSGEAVLSGVSTTAHIPYYVAPAPKGDDGNNGLTPDTPKETLAAIAAIATEPGAIIHAAPGVYDKGVSGPRGTSVTTNRVIVAAGVGLQGDEGAAVTVIEGKQDPVYATSTNVIRCCFLEEGAWIRGFTLRGGAAAKVSSTSDTGGGVCGATPGTKSTTAAIECVFTNNVACRGNSTADVDLIRCIVYGTGNTTSSGFGESYNLGRLIDCVFANAAHAYTLDAVVNCTFDLGQTWSSGNTDWCKDGRNMAFNSIIHSTSMNKRFCNCVFTTPRSQPAPELHVEFDDDCRFNVAVPLDANYRPLATDTNVVDRGRNDYYDTYFPARWAQFKNGRDFAGGPRHVGSSIDIGAGEFDWNSTPSGIPGLKMTVTEGASSGTWELSLASDPDAEKPCTGFVYRGERVSFADHPFGWAWTRTVTVYPKRADIEPIAESVLYVDPDGGDDGRRGYHPDIPLATITRAMELVSEHGVIHCAAGTYSIANGNAGVYSYHYTKDATDYDYEQTNVVCFTKDYVTLVADEGPDRTVIEGVLTEGAEAVRGVKMQDHCVTQGFTIRNCATWKNGADDNVLYGGGVNNGTAVDCVISNCWSGNRGGSSANSRMVRCLIGLGCRSPRTTYGAGGHAGQYYGCVFRAETYTGNVNAKIVNCTFLGCAPRSSSSEQPVLVYNTFIDGNSNGRCAYYNCKLTGYRNTSIEPFDAAYGNTEFSVKKSEYAYDPVTYRPLAGSELIDAGSNETFAAYYPADYLDLDFAGGQRVYNGTVDIGPGEYDARPDFAKALDGRRMAVDVATAGVTLGDGKSLVMKGGDELALRWTVPVEGPCSFRVTADAGTVAVTVDGADVMPDTDGVYAFVGTVGEHEVSISYAGEGSATVDSFVCPRKGVILLVR